MTNKFVALADLIQAKMSYKALNSIAPYFRARNREEFEIQMKLASLIELIATDRIGIRALDISVFTYHTCLIVSIRTFSKSFSCSLNHEFTP